MRKTDKKYNYKELIKELKEEKILLKEIKKGDKNKLVDEKKVMNFLDKKIKKIKNDN